MGDSLTNMGFFWEIKKLRSQKLIKTPQVLGGIQALETLKKKISDL